MASQANAHAEPGLNSAQYRVSIPPHVVYRHLVAETVMLNVQTGKYYGLNQTAGRMLEALERQPDLDAIIADLATELDAPEEVLKEDFMALCFDLAEKGLLHLEPVQ